MGQRVLPLLLALAHLAYVQASTIYCGNYNTYNLEECDSDYFKCTTSGCTRYAYPWWMWLIIITIIISIGVGIYFCIRACTRRQRTPVTTVTTMAYPVNNGMGYNFPQQYGYMGAYGGCPPPPAYGQYPPQGDIYDYTGGHVHGVAPGPPAPCPPFVPPPVMAEQPQIVGLPTTMHTTPIADPPFQHPPVVA